MVEIRFPDGASRKYQKGVTGGEIALSISEGFARKVLSVTYNKKQIELSTPFNESGDIVFHTWESIEGKYAFWHSSAHVLAQTILDFYPNAKLTLGPPIEEGFYYDIDFGSQKLSDKDFEKLEKRFLEHTKEKYKFKLFEVTKKEALKTCKDNHFKIEIIESITDDKITFCKHADFIDLCRGIHLPHTGFIKAVKITRVAGAYWRGDENRTQLTRVYGISFPKKKDLETYLHNLELAKLRDHRKIGKQMGLFSFSDRVGQGLPLWLPKGTELRNKLISFMSDAQRRAGYEFVTSPHIGHKNLYQTSGHYEKYGNDSFKPIYTPDENEEFLLKPMNCPHHCEIYKSKTWSYKELPVRYAEYGTVYRYEKSGELHGLIRVRGFTQDDAHLFCRQDQLLDEFKAVIDLVLYVFRTLGFSDFTVQISLRDKENNFKYIGDDYQWDMAEQAIIQATSEKNLKTITQFGEAAFYGPKLDFLVKDALGRKWQLGTVQVDYNLPERFDLWYKGSDNKKHRPVMIHRAPFGSLERFIGVLIEQTGGDFPLWLIPIPVKIIPVDQKFNKYAKKVLYLLNNSEIRALVDDRNEKIGRKIRDAEMEKIPFMLVVGEKEQLENSVSVRRHKVGDIGVMETKEFVLYIKKELEFDNFKTEKL